MGNCDRLTGNGQCAAATETADIRRSRNRYFAVPAPAGTGINCQPARSAAGGPTTTGCSGHRNIASATGSRTIEAGRTHEVTARADPARNHHRSRREIGITESAVGGKSKSIRPTEVPRRKIRGNGTGQANCAVGRLIDNAQITHTRDQRHRQSCVDGRAAKHAGGSRRGRNSILSATAIMTLVTANLPAAPEECAVQCLIALRPG